MAGSTLVSVNIQDVPGLQVLQGFSSSVLGLSLSVWLVLELYRLLVRGQCDFVTPIVRVGIGFAVVGSLPWIGDAVSGLFQSTSDQLAAQNSTALLGQAFQKALQDVESLDLLSAIGSFFSVKGLLSMGSLCLYLSMMILKVAIIDVLWPICMGLVVVLGLVAVPLGVLPGLTTLSGWFKNLIEVSLWPLVFQMLVGMMAASMKGTLQAVLNLQGVWTDAILGDASAGTTAVGTATGLMVLVRWWALCWGYVLLCLLTPLISSLAVRSEPVAAIGTQMAKMAVQIGSAAVGALSSAGLSRFVGSESGLGGGGLGAGVGALETRAASIRRELPRSEEQIDRRSYGKSGAGRGGEP
jgi:hypothetical protein